VGWCPTWSPHPGVSLYTVNLLSTLFTMKLTRLLWRQVYLPVSSITRQQFRMWSVVPLLGHSLHRLELVYFHLHRLAGVARVLHCDLCFLLICILRELEVGVWNPQ